MREINTLFPVYVLLALTSGYQILLQHYNLKYLLFV